MSKESLFGKAWFWAVTGVVAAVCCGFSFLLFPRALPILSLEISMDHSTALACAREIAVAEGWGPRDFRQVAQFSEASNLRRYVELEGGGVEAFRALVGQKWAATHTWSVRHFQPNDQEEAVVYFFPDGERAGFWRFLPESRPGEMLSELEAREVAERAASTSWGMQLAEWKLVEHGERNHPGGRRDHKFVYERALQKPGEGIFRWRLDVSGNELTASYRFAQIPESFSNRYAEQRSSNEALAGLAGSVIALVYGVGGVIALILLGRKRWLVWKPAFGLAAVLTLLSVAEAWSSLPSAWFQYDTSADETDFLWNLLVDRGGTLFLGTLAMGLLVCLGESISRRSFGSHPQIWRFWSPGVVSSDGILGRTLGGYLLCTFDLLYMVGFYLVATQLWGWWSPVFSIADPNILAMRLPWAGPLANALQAGVLEECLFRALPLSAAILLGRRLGRERLCVGVALVLQAFVFSAAHASYESFPAYFRLVELMVPSLVAGVLFLRWGLIPVILTHFLYDAVLMNLPLFATRFEGAWVHQSIALAAVGAPLAVVVLSRMRTSVRSPLPQGALNAGWRKDAPSGEKVAPAPRPKVAQRLIPERVLWGVAGVCAALLAYMIFSREPSTHLALDRSGAILKAREFLLSNGIELGAEWVARARVVSATPSREEILLVEKNTADAVRAVAGYVPRIQWSVEFCRFTGDAAERTRRYVVGIFADGKTLGLARFLPESAEGASLHEACARELALECLERTIKVPVHFFEEVSSNPEKLPARTDWTFVFRDTRHDLAEGFQARVSLRIAGDQLVQTFSFIHVPEQILVEHTNRAASARKLVSIVDFLGTVLMMACVIHAGVCAARGRWNARLFRILLLLLTPFIYLSYLNGWPGAEAGFETVKPLNHQWFEFLSSSLQGTVGLAGISCLLAGTVFHASNLSEIPLRRIVLGAITMALATRVSFLCFVRGAGTQSPATNDFFAGHSWIMSLHGLSIVIQITSALGIIAYIALMMSRISGGFRRGWIWEPVFVFAVLLYCCSSNSAITNSTSVYLLTALTYTLPISLGFRFFMGRCPEGGPLFVCTLSGIINFEDLWDPVLPGQRACSLVAITVAGAFSVAWGYWIDRQRARFCGSGSPPPGEPGYAVENGMSADAEPGIEVAGAQVPGSFPGAANPS
jgi:hypothetical protein